MLHDIVAPSPMEIAPFLYVFVGEACASMLHISRLSLCSVRTVPALATSDRSAVSVVRLNAELNLF